MPTGVVRVQLPRALLEFWDAPQRVELEAATLAELAQALNARWPGLGARVFDDQGRVRQHVHVFVNEEAIDGGAPERVPLKGGDTVHIVPALSGG